jgi:hypothetical protein
VNDTFPNQLSGQINWTCSTAGGANCGGGNGNGTINRTVNMPVNSTITFTTTSGSVSNTTTATSLSNTATVTAPANRLDTNTANNSATDTTSIVVVSVPTLNVLDSFNRNNATSLGSNWSQPNNNIRLNGNNAQHNNGNSGFAYWKGAPVNGTIFGSVQGAAFTLANNSAATNNGNSLILKASGGTLTAPTNYIRVRVNGNNDTIVVESTTNSGGNFTQLASFSVNNISNGDTFTARVNADGSVDVWQNAAYLGHSSTSAFTGSGRIGMRLSNNGRVDNFRGGTLP